MRGLPPLCLAVALVGCSGGVALGQGEPEPAPTEPAPNAKPDPLAELVLQRRRRVGAPGVPSLPNPVRSFARDDEKSDTAYFVRLVGAKIGGEFDAAGDEEVQFDVLVGRESRKLYREVLDLPSGALGDFAFDGPWLELRPKETLRFDLNVRDEDLTEWETITGTEETCEVRAEDVGLTPQRRSIALETISTVEMVFIFSKTVVIKDPSADVEWVSAPRRKQADASSKAIGQPLFAAALALDDLEAPGAAAVLGETLEACAKKTMHAAGHSTHTHVRAVFPKLATALNDIAGLAHDVGATSRIPSRQATVAKRISSVPPSEAALPDFAAILERARVLTATAAPVTQNELDAVFNTALDIGARLDRLGKNAPQAAIRLNTALDALLIDLSRAQRGFGKLDALISQWTALREKLGAEL